MGQLHYNSETFAFEDRTLLHLQLVIGLKLRRREPFFLSWRAEPAVGSGRHALWIDNGVPIHVEYTGGRAASLNRDWVEHLINAANSGSGLNLADDHNQEPDSPSAPPTGK
ncbi:hypothetical protein MT349_19325 [Rathayibacter caricis]|uniref:DUF7882 family protein n=1 Tax=Rathayibacter caricis TaxID=110936 RepID=UPI001FB3DC84|nr:hypothetical protein [Rathayibacter caricis]MCJ1697939.1 hypothetical protein [Rathayibacter caricis]